MLKLRDIMTTDVITLTPDTTLRQAADALSRRHVTGAPVVSERGIVGVVSTTDLLAFAASHASGPTEHELEPSRADWNRDEAAGTPPVSADAYFTELWTAVGEDVSEPPVEMEGPEWDALDEHTVEEVMTRKLWMLGPDEDVTVAASLMEQNGIHRVVIAEQGKLVGVVTGTDIAAAVASDRIRTRTYVFTHHPVLDERGTE